MEIKSIVSQELGISIMYKPELKRARKPINRSQSWIRPKIPSMKCSIRKMIHCESLAEECFVNVLECNRFISDYFEQPALIKYIFDGKVEKHYPDFLYIKEGSLIFVEIKKTFKDVTPDVLCRTELLKKLLPEIGYSYELVVISEMDPILISNSQEVFEKARYKFKANYFPACLDCKEEFVWKEFSLPEQAKIAELILKGYFDIDWAKPINANSRIFKVTAGELKWAS